MADTIKTAESYIDADKSNTPATSALNVTNQTSIDACRAVTASTAASYELYFTDAPTTKITIYMLAGILYPYTPAGWYYESSALKDVLIMFFASQMSRKHLNIGCQIVSDAGLILSVSALMDEFFFQPTVPQINDYLMLSIVLLWTLKIGWKSWKS